jgi:hypothetical protein
MVSPESHPNWFYPSGDHNRIKICFSWIVQVRNMPPISIFSIKNHLDIHSWMISSESHLNWFHPSGDHNRLKICFSWMTQVRNLPTRGCFFPSEYALKIHSWRDSTDSHVNCVLTELVPTTESKSVYGTVPVQVRNLPVTMFAFYRNTAALKICASSKRADDESFPVGTHFDIQSWMNSSAVHLN